MSGGESEILEDAYRRGAAGDLSGELPKSDSSFRFAVQLQRWLAGADVPMPSPPPEALVVPARAADAAGAIALCTQMRRRAVLAFDEKMVRAAAERVSAVAERHPGAVDAHEVNLNALWASWARGAPDVAAVDEVAAKARGESRAQVAVEAQVLRGLHELAAGDTSAAVGSVRRATRMARVEGVPDLEVLAGVALARARRFDGRPQLALRILRALAPHAPPPWRRWICWEALLGGARFAGWREDAGLLGSLLRACDAAEAGRIDETKRACALVRTHAEAFGALRRDALGAASLLGVDAIDGPADLRAWIAGEFPEVPRAMNGFIFSGDPEGRETSCVFVVAGPQRAARRVLTRSIPLSIAALNADDATASAPTRPRADAGLSTLAFCGDAVPLAAYFAQLYGYEFEATVHRAMLNMHAKRMRDRIGDGGELVRDGDTIRLVVTRTLLLRDSRCEQSAEDRVMSVLAQSGALSTSELARRLKMPLRTVQRILRELHLDAGVEQRKEGREIKYAVEDTTFSEPTRTRRFDPVLGPA